MKDNQEEKEYKRSKRVREAISKGLKKTMGVKTRIVGRLSKEEIAQFQELDDLVKGAGELLKKAVRQEKALWELVYKAYNLDPKKKYSIKIKTGKVYELFDGVETGKNGE